MRTDAYTKVMLTVIAACLLWICARSAGQTVIAQAQPAQYSPLPAQPVVVVGWGRLNPAAPGGVEIEWADPQRRISQSALTVRQGLDPDSAFRVRIDPMQGLLPVSVESVRRGQAWDPMRVQVEREPPRPTPGIGVGVPNPR
jgi:hypothetical protein